MRRNYSVPIWAVFSLLAASPVFAATIDPAQLREDIAASQRMQDLSRQMNARVQDRMDTLLAQVDVPEFQHSEMTQQPGGAIIIRPSGRTEKGAFLGLSGSPVGTVLREQLKLPRGACLVVDYVAKDSPAEAAGIKVHDILEKMDDQLIVNPQQLLVLVRNKKPGDVINLTILHEGDSAEVSAKLIEKDLPVLEDEESGMVMTGPAMEMNPVPLGGQIEVSPFGVRRSVHIEADGSTTRTLDDGNNRFMLRTDKAGVSTLVIEDRDGKEIFNGPFTTDDDKAKLPPEFARKIQELTALKPRETLSPETRSMSLSRTDGEHEIHVTVDEKGKRCVVKDVKTGGVIFDGMVNDPDTDMKTVDPVVVAKVKALLDKAQAK